MIQACINGARSAGFHPALPLTIEAMVHDVQACLAAGASEIHLHPRNAAGAEDLDAVSETIRTIRLTSGDAPLGVSTGAWIEKDEAETRRKIAGWTDLPDYASVNLSEADAPAVMDLLIDKGVGIEAGLASTADAERLLQYPKANSILRVLIEIDEQELDKAIAGAHAVQAMLEKARFTKPILLHAYDPIVWPFIHEARARGFATRVGLEDGKLLPDGAAAGSNAVLVAAAATIFRKMK